MKIIEADEGTLLVTACRGSSMRLCQKGKKAQQCLFQTLHPCVSMQYMEKHCERFPMADRHLVLAKAKAKLAELLASPLLKEASKWRVAGRGAC